MNKKLVFSIIAVLFIAFIYFFKTKESKNINELIIGTASGYAPYVSINPQGKYEGFDIDVAEEIAKRMNKKLVLKDMGSMVPLMLSLKNGSVDLLIWALEINQTRLKEMEMVQYQGGNITSYPMIFWKEIPAGISSLEDLKKYPEAQICVEPGSSQEKFLNRFDFINKKPMEKVVDMVMDLKYGKSMAAMIDPAVLKDVTSKSPELKVLQIPLDSDSMSYGNGICIKKGNTELAEQIRTIIAVMKADGTMKKLEQKWMLQ